MHPKTGGRNRPVLIFLIVLAIIIITAYYRGSKGMVQGSQRLVFSLVAPVQKGVASIIRPLRNAYVYSGAVRTAISDNRELTAENVSLQAEIAKLRKYKIENRKLRKLAGFRAQSQFETVAAHVISRSPTSWQSLMTIDLGKNDGVGNKMTVIANKGLVGQVVQVSSSAALVQLVDDQRSGVAVELKRTGATGIAEGRMRGKLRLRFVATDVDVRKGDKVLTSGVGGIFLRGIPIGEVLDVTDDPYSLEKRVTIKPAVDYARLSTVLVITNAATPVEGK